MKWGYQRVKCGTVQESDMDEQGEDGWELVQILQDENGDEVAIFKRLLPDADQDDDRDTIEDLIDHACDIILKRIDSNQTRTEEVIKKHAADRLWCIWLGFCAGLLCAAGTMPWWL